MRWSLVSGGAAVVGVWGVVKVRVTDRGAGAYLVVVFLWRFLTFYFRLATTVTYSSIEIL